MKSRINVITIGVNDLEKSLAFYRDGLGLPTKGIVGEEFEDGAVVFFEMNDNLTLALYPRASLAKDAKVPVAPPSPTELSIGQLVKSKADVDAVWNRRKERVLRLPTPHAIASGEDIQATFKILTATCGKSYGIRNLSLRTKP